MNLPSPRAGLVVNYEYLWWRELQDGLEIGEKPRPCAVVIAVRKGGRVVSEVDDPYRVLILPITTQAPRAAQPHVGLSPSVKRGLGLDPGPSWVMLSEANLFTWPGVDLRLVESTGRWEYGDLPSPLTLDIARRFRVLTGSGQVKIIPRTT